MLRRDAVFDDVALRPDQAQSTVVELNGLVFVDQAEVVGREVGEDRDLLLEAIGDLLVGRERQAHIRIGLGHHRENLVALVRHSKVQ